MAGPELANGGAVDDAVGDLVTYEALDEGRIARIWLNRPDEHNAQNCTPLVQLDDAFRRAEADDDMTSGRALPCWSGPLAPTCIPDLIVAADNARFSDVVAARLGMPGVEYFAHPWEFGPRKANELLLTGDALDADEAYRLGIVSKIFPVDELEEKTVEFARRIAGTATMAALLIKDSVNAAADGRGFIEALRHAFHTHELGPCALGRPQREQIPRGQPPDVPDWRTAGRTQIARRDTP